MPYLQPCQSMPLSTQGTYTIFNEGMSCNGSWESYGAFVVNQTNPSIQEAQSIGPSAKATVNATTSHPSTLINTGGTVLLVTEPT